MSKMKEEAARLAAAALDTAMLPSFNRRQPRVAMNRVTDFTGELEKVEAELVEVKAKLELYDNSAPTRKLETATIKPSRFANRISDSFEDPAFEGLKAEISNAGGNVQPIKVRPVGENEYEIAFGHRRHRACADLGLPVLATIAVMSDKELFEEMSRENEGRKDLSAYELALHYKRGIDLKLYKNWSEIAAVLGKSRPLLARYSALSELPKTVVDAFPSPNDIQPKWAVTLRQVLEADSHAVVKVAKDLKGRGLAAKAVFEALINQPKKVLTRVNFGSITWTETDGRIKIELDATKVPAEQIEEMKAYLKERFGDVNPG